MTSNLTESRPRLLGVEYVSQSVICSGCGTRLEVREDYARKKMRCGQCGVIFDLPEPSDRSSVPARPAIRPAAPPPPKHRPADKKADPVAAAPVSRTHVPEPAASPSTSVKAQAPSPPPLPDEHSLDDSDDDFAFVDGKDDRPYEKAEGAIRECPHCHATVNPEAKACSACGFLLLVKRPNQQSVAYRWESGWSFRYRLVGFLICQALAVTAVITGTIAGMSPFTFVFPYVMFTGMTAFLFGSYNWVDLTRNKKGKLRLTQTLRICFVARPPSILRIRDYEDVATGVEHQFDTSDWIMVLFLSLLGILPGLWWWFYVGSKDTYFVSLCRDHGYPVVTLYRGWNREQMEDMAETICTVA